ncbi:MAG: type II toxin-antitoxin system prevent-host-death family antitoxin [Pseudomonadota bacterium]
MNKIVSASEFKAKCLRLIDEMQADGVPITITKRGKPVAEMSPSTEHTQRPKSLFGSMKGTFTVHGDLDEPIDPDWEAKWNAKWDERGFTVRPDAK